MSPDLSPLIVEQTPTISKTLPYHTSEPMPRRGAGMYVSGTSVRKWREILLTLFIIGHGSGLKNNNDEQETRENENDLLLMMTAAKDDENKGASYLLW